MLVGFSIFGLVTTETLKETKKFQFILITFSKLSKKRGKKNLYFSVLCFKKCHDVATFLVRIKTQSIF